MTLSYADAVGGALSKMIVAGRKARERFIRAGDEIARYGYAPDYGFEYQTLPKAAFFRAKVGMTAEAIRVFGPYLYQANPHRTVTTRPWAAPQSQQIASIMDQYLNYTPNECDLYGHSRRAIDESITYGRSVLWTGLHPKKKMVCSTWGSIRELIVDGDAQIPEDIKWIGRRMTIPRMDLLEEIPEAENKIKSLPKGNTKQTDDTSVSRENAGNSGSDTVTFWKIWTKRGLAGYESGKDIVNAWKAEHPGEEFPNEPRLFYVTEKGEMLWEGDWEVPLHLDDMWPCEWLDYFDHPLSIWPASPLEPGIGYQRAINWVVTLLMGKYRFTSRLAMAIVRRNGQGLSDADKDKIMVGSDIEALLLNVNGGDTDNVSKFIHEFKWDNNYLEHGMRFMDMLENKFQKATGLYEILYSGQSGTQSRTATDAQMKDRNSRSRIEDMRDRVLKWQSKIARKEALVARFLHTREDIGRVLGPDAAQQWGFLVKPDQNVLQDMVNGLVNQGMPVDQAVMQAQQMASQAVDYDKWRLETDYGVEADSMKRHDLDTRIDALKEQQNQVVPTLLQSPIPQERAMAFTTMAAYYEAVGCTPDIVQMYRKHAMDLMAQPPMPPPVNQAPAK